MTPDIDALVANATPEQVDRANQAVLANLQADGSPRYDSAQGYARALTAIVVGDTALSDEIAVLKEREGWQPIETYTGCGPVLVSKPTDKYVYTATTAFKDVTGVWRVFRSLGGMEPLSWQPTHWRSLPDPPALTDKAGS